MRVHFDVLGWLHTLVGAVGLAAGVSLGILGVSTMTLAEAEGPLGHPIARLLLIVGAVIVVAGAAMMSIGRSLRRRQRGGRRAALVAAAINLAILPFGTALGIYAFWVLVNDEARLAFGRPTRAPDIQSGS